MCQPQTETSEEHWKDEMRDNAWYYLKQRRKYIER